MINDNVLMKSMKFQLEVSNEEFLGEQFTDNLDNPEQSYDVGEGMEVNMRAYAPDFVEIDENGALISETPVAWNTALVLVVTDGGSSELSLLQIMLSTDITQNNDYSVKFVENE